MSAEATPLNVASLSVEERQSSSISAIISSIERAVEDFYYDEEYAHPLKNHVVGLDEDRTVIFVKADIDSGCLKNGKDPEKISHTLAVQYGVPADSVYQLIGKKIGGHGKPSNVFPVNPNVLHDWKSDEDVVYSHVQKVNCYASLTFAFKYGDENEPLRPSDIYYRIQLFENGKSIDNAIERHIKNTLVPPKTFHLTFADYSKNNV
uniref:Uncharacterized protein n=1 Tax=Panagrolaimus sp. PS1159 TaxID=55785 RepID=A0AC35FBE3_9BILA